MDTFSRVKRKFKYERDFWVRNFCVVHWCDCQSAVRKSQKVILIVLTMEQMFYDGLNANSRIEPSNNLRDGIQASCGLTLLPMSMVAIYPLFLFVWQGLTVCASSWMYRKKSKVISRLCASLVYCLQLLSRVHSDTQEQSRHGGCLESSYLWKRARPRGIYISTALQDTARFPLPKIPKKLQNVLRGFFHCLTLIILQNLLFVKSNQEKCFW